MNDGNVLYAEINNNLVLKFVGEIRYTSCIETDRFLHNTFCSDKYDDILVDLNEATSLDSTTLGLLAQISNFVREKHHHKASIFSTKEDIDRTLETVGFDSVFNILKLTTTAGARVQPLPEVDADDKEMAKVILSTHKTLCELNEGNKEVFKDVVAALESDLAESE